MASFRQLQALHAVIQTGTVTGAAAQLGISQPGVSNLLNQLESQTGLALFNRSRGRIHPTPEARVLSNEFDTVVRGFDQISQTVTDLKTLRSGHLQLVCTHALSQGLIPQLISDFLIEQPEVTVSFDARYSARIQEWVVSQLFELGITELPIYHENLKADHFQFECRCVVNKKSPLANRLQLTPGELDNVPVIVMGNDHMTHHRIREAFVQSTHRLNIRCQVNLFRTALDFVKQGLGVAFIDPFTLADDDDDGYVSIPFAPSVIVDLAIIHSPNRPLSAVGNAFLDILRDRLGSFSDASRTG